MNIPNVVKRSENNSVLADISKMDTPQAEKNAITKNKVDVQPTQPQAVNKAQPQTDVQGTLNFARCSPCNPLMEMGFIKAKKAPIIAHLKSFSISINLQCNDEDFSKHWNKFEHFEKKNLAQLHKMGNKLEAANIDIHIGSANFVCDKNVLQAYTNFFANCETTKVVDLPVEEVTLRAFKLLYQWMISEQFEMQQEFIVEVLHTARFLRITTWLDQFWLMLMDNETPVREENAFALYSQAKQYKGNHTTSLKYLMMIRVQKFFLTLVASKDFLAMSATELCELLKSDTIGVNTEAEVFWAMVRWVNYDWEQRKCHVMDIIQTIRFALFPLSYMITISLAPECDEVKRIVTYQTIPEMIRKSIYYSAALNCFGQNSKKFKQLIQSCEILVPRERTWIFDQKCAYHHRADCKNMKNQDFTYQLFNDYMSAIQDVGQTYWRELKMAKNMCAAIKCCAPAQTQDEYHLR